MTLTPKMTGISIILNQIINHFLGSRRWNQAKSRSSVWWKSHMPINWLWLSFRTPMQLDLTHLADSWLRSLIIMWDKLATTSPFMYTGTMGEDKDKLSALCLLYIAPCRNAEKLLLQKNTNSTYRDKYKTGWPSRTWWNH